MNTLLCIEQAPEQLNLDTLNNKTPIRGKLSFFWSSECHSELSPPWKECNYVSNDEKSEAGRPL